MRLTTFLAILSSAFLVTGVLGHLPLDVEDLVVRDAPDAEELMVSARDILYPEDEFEERDIEDIDLDVRGLDGEELDSRDLLEAVLETLSRREPLGVVKGSTLRECTSCHQAFKVDDASKTQCPSCRKKKNPIQKLFGKN